jgi:hypothetical protein
MEQVQWSNTTNDSFYKVTAAGKDAGESWNWQLFRNVFNWGIWKVFGQVAEPYDGAVSGMYKDDSIIIIGNDIFFYCFRKRCLWHICLLICNWFHSDIKCTSSECSHRDV